MAEISDRAHLDRRSWLRAFSWLPIPLLLAAIAALWVADLRVAWHLRSLNWLINYGSVALGVAFIIIPAARTVLANGQPSVLMLGCGVLIMDIGAAVMPIAAARSTSTGFAVYNISTVLSALCHLIGVAVISRRTVRLTRSSKWLAVAYAGGAAAMGLVIWGAFAGWMPAFFIEGQGGTLLRSLVVSAAVALFALTAWLLWQANRRAASPFLCWYSLGLVLMAAGLAGSMLIVVWDSPLQWVTRSTQFIGGVYMCVAVLAAARQNKAGSISLAAVEEAWQESGFLSNLREQTPLGWVLRYTLAVAAVAAAMALRLALSAWIGPGLPVYVTFYPAVMAVALLAGFGPGLLATALAALTAAYWVLPPVGQFSIESPVDRLGLAVFAGMGLFMSGVAHLYRRNRDKAAAYDREAALRESEERYRNLFENMTEEVHFWKLVRDGNGQIKTWRLVDANPPTLKTWGRKTVEEVRGKTTDEIFGPGATEHYMPVVEKVMTEGVPSVYEDYFPNLDKHFRFTTVPLGDHFITTGADITGIRKSHEALRQSEERLRELSQRLTYHVDNSPLAVIEWGPDMRLTRWSGAAERIFGWKPEEVLGKRMEDFRWIYKEDVAQVAEVSNELQNGANSHRFSANRNYRKDGSIVNCEWYNSSLLDESGELRSILSLVLDVTERKYAESALQATLQRFYVVLSSMYSAVLLVTDEGRVEFANQAFCDRYGLKDAPADLVGLESRAMMEKIKNAYLHPDEAIARIREILARGQPVKGEELAMKDGGTCLRDFVPLNVHGKPYGRLWLHMDITERKRAEELVRDSERRERERAEELAVLLESVPAGVFIARDPDCLHLEGNRLADEILRIPQRRRALAVGACAKRSQAISGPSRTDAN